MRRILVALAVLSTLVMAQSGLAGTPTSSWPEPVLEHFAGATPDAYEAAALAPSGGEGPTPASLVLLLAGLFGLTVAGDPRDKADPRAPR